MSTKLKICMCMVFTCLYAKNSNAQEVAKSTADIVVHVDDQDIAGRPMVLSVVNDYVYGGHGSIEHVATADKEGNFKFHLIGLNNPVLITILRDRYSSVSKSYLRSTIVGSELLEPGDSLTIDFKVKKQTKKISGTGSAKFLAWQQIMQTKPDNTEWFKFRSSSFSKGFLDSLVECSDSAYVFGRRILLSYKNMISQEAFERLDARIYGRTYSSLVRNLMIHINKSENKEILLEFFRDYGKYAKSGSVEASGQSQEYLEFLIQKGKAIANLMDPDPKNKFIRTYKELIKQQSGILREKVLLSFFSNNLSASGAENSDDIYLDALNYIKTPDYRMYLANLAAAKRKGNDAYNFKMPDETGKMVSLLDFRGKVVVIDCWFTGCSSCAAMAKRMEKDVLPNFKDNPEVVFVSVNVDRSKEMWLNSVKSGMYTNPQSVNLYTEGLELKHPFIYEYKLRGFPQLLLIDKNGKIFTPSMPRDTKGMNEVINEALKIDKQINLPSTINADKSKL